VVVHIIFENEDWMPPIRSALASRGVPFREHLAAGGVIDVNERPEPGIYYNRMSPSSHTRGHQAGVIYARELFRVLEEKGVRVINGSRAFGLELSKVAQHAALGAAGLLTPRTIAVCGGHGEVSRAARRMAPPFITKDNQGGKGLGVRLFHSHAALDEYVGSSDFQPGPDGVVLLQQYIEPAEPFITRVEIVDGRFLYAIRSSTERGFQLCPADACAIDDAFCPVGDSGTFSLAPEVGPDDPLVRSYLALCARYGLDIAGIEFVTDAQGRRWTYDINANTNYNGAVEAAHGLSGMTAVAALCERLLNDPSTVGGTMPAQVQDAGQGSTRSPVR